MVRGHFLIHGAGGRSPGPCGEPRREAEVWRSAPNFTRVLLAATARPDSARMSRQDLREQGKGPGNCSCKTGIPHRVGVRAQAVSAELSFVWSLRPGWRQLRSLLPSVGREKLSEEKPYRKCTHVAGKLKARRLERTDFHWLGGLHFMLKRRHSMCCFNFRQLDRS